MQSLFIHGIGTLATPVGSRPAKGRAMHDDVRLLRDAAILVENGTIAGVFAQGERPGTLAPGTATVDAGGRLLTPGLVDAHTHLCFGGWRQQEAAQRAQGVDYMTILRGGGGILDTVRKTRAADEGDLLEKGRGFVWEMLARGVTTCEAKSGYGLDIDTELKQLRVARALAESTPMQIASTYLGAHAVPPEYADRPEAYVRFLLEDAIPAIAASGLAEFCDVFCEEGVFDIEQSRRILECAKALGMLPKLHADEIVPMGGGGLAAEVEAISADHLIAVSDESLEALSRSDTVAVLLPQTSLYLGKPMAPARRMIDTGLAVALATDFNPGSCPSNNLPLSMSLAFLKYRLTPEEVLTAVTRNAACAVGLCANIGTVEVGKQADFVLWDAEDVAMICYRMGSNLVHAVYKQGRQLDCHNRRWADA